MKTTRAGSTESTLSFDFEGSASSASDPSIPRETRERPAPQDPALRAVPVSVFVARLNNALRTGFPDTWIRGEVSDFKVWSSGHAYFTLKDRAASLAAMMWADNVARLPFRPEPGLELLALGRPNVYPASGRLTFVVSNLQPLGVGALQLAFEQLRKKLHAEGLFDTAKKRPLPLLPRRIGIVTSRNGAAIRDLLKVLSSRFPGAHVTLYPVTVQGIGAASEIARAVAAFSRARGADVLIVARGGGSKEDLAVFNDERVVRAVAASRIPTISAVGHEIDVTLTDLAADVRAATPSQAAELVVARRDEFDKDLQGLDREIQRALRERLLGAGAQLDGLARHPALAGFPSRVGNASLRSDSMRQALVASFRRLPASYGERLLRLEARVAAWPSRAALPHQKARVQQDVQALADRLRARVATSAEALARAAGRLSALDPLRLLARGYSVAYREGEPAPLVDAGRVSPGDTVRLVLSRGELLTRVLEANLVSRAAIPPQLS